MDDNTSTHSSDTSPLRLGRAHSQQVHIRAKFHSPNVLTPRSSDVRHKPPGTRTMSTESVAEANTDVDTAINHGASMTARELDAATALHVWPRMTMSKRVP
ncbi:hypothetical protein NM688_g3846 [Phlebia brevispora]|uniref:Uncharacterized protein n=1 Tax=Phlebia brevispora TaxID=194682 RepID=A0ACC1T588_9APHY|nr:hypothetical protein NM688_g3846 [Phlebia brevispora]